MDSFQDRLLFFDDFHGDQLQDEWALTVVATGTGAVVDAQTGGIYRLSAATNATNDEARIDWGGAVPIRSLLVTKKATMEVRVKLTQTTLMQAFLNLRFDANNEIIFSYDTNVGANWLIQSIDGGVPTNQDSGIAATTNYVILRMECHTHGGNHVHFYIDGVQAANSPITTNIPDDAGDYLMPYLRIITLAAAVKSMDIDYVYLRQER